MIRQQSRSVRLIYRLRWLIPIAVAFLGISYIFAEEVLLSSISPVWPRMLVGLVVLGLIGPALFWVVLSWAARTARAEAWAQDELTFRNQQLAALNAIGETANRGLDVQEILHDALERVVKLLHLEAADVWLEEGSQLVLKSHYGVSSEFVAQANQMEVDQCICGRCARSGQALVVADLTANPSLALSCAREGFLSAISVPMQAHGRLVGVLHVGSRRPAAFGQREQELLTAVAERLALVLENTRLFSEARARARQLETASLVGQRITALLDLNSLLLEVTRLVREKFGYYQVHILLVDEQDHSLVLREACGRDAERVKARKVRLKIGEQGITGWVAHTGQTLVANDVRREPLYALKDLLPDTAAELAVPLRVGSRVVGVLDVQSDHTDAFTKEDATVLQILGNQLGVAIENARLFEETRRRYEAMIALHDVSLDMISQLDMPVLLESLLRRGAALLGGQSGSLFLYDEQKQIIYNVANHNTWRDWTGVTVRPGEGVIGQVILSGKPVIVNDYPNWPYRAPVFAGAPHKVTIGAPLKWENKIIGGIVIGNQPPTDPFTDADAWLLALFADLATIAIKNAELHTQVKEFNQGLERQVARRTEELSRAKEEIAAKAEQLRSLLAKTIHIQEEEQARIARDMHDGVVQLITAMRYEVQAARLTMNAGRVDAAQEKLSSVREILEEMEREIRSAIYDLHPPTLDAVGLLPALERYVRNFEELFGIRCPFVTSGTPVRLPPDTEMTVFRLVETALQNVAVHARATCASVNLHFTDSALFVSVEDDGQGFDYERWITSRDFKHLGLVSMQERTRILNGEMTVHSTLGRGTRMEFHLPLPLSEYPSFRPPGERVGKEASLLPQPQPQAEQHGG